VFAGLRRRLSYANVTATLALFVALGGTAAATTTFVVNSNADIAPGTVSGAKPPAGLHGNIIAKTIASADLAGGAVANAKLAADAVDSSKVADGSLTGADLATDTVTGAQIAESTLGTVPSAANALSLGGVPSSGYQTVLTSSCPVGSAIAGISQDGSVSCNAESVGPGYGGGISLTVAAQHCLKVEFVVGGVAVGDTAIVVPDGATWPAGLIYQTLRADKAGHVAVEVCNPTTASVSSGNVTVSIWDVKLNP
jgi:hypothetical protein